MLEFEGFGLMYPVSVITHATVEPSATALGERPLVIDLDGTLIRSDCLVETFFACLGTNPAQALLAMLSLRRGKAALKAELTGHAKLDVSRLPLNAEVLGLISAEKARGRRVYLASAADQALVAEFAHNSGLFDGVFASDGRRNLSGRAKAAVLCKTFGEGGFDYIGNDAADLAIWEKAGRVLVADAPAALLRRVVARWPDAQILSKRRLRARTYLKAIRVHHWAKNLLVFVPALAAHRWGLADLATCLLAFLSFSLCASSVYVTKTWSISLGTVRTPPSATGPSPRARSRCCTGWQWRRCCSSAGCSVACWSGRPSCWCCSPTTPARWPIRS